MMGNEMQPDVASVAQMQKEADLLIASIIKKQLANEKVQEKAVAVTEAVLLGENPGWLKKFFRMRLVNMFARMMSMTTKRLGVEDTDISADLGRLCSLQLMIQNQTKSTVTGGDNAADAHKAAEKIDAFLSNLDFGEIYERVEGTGPALVERTEIIKTAIVENHTGKLAALAPTMMVLTNNMLALTSLFGADHKDMPPDFVADFMAGLINMVDGETLGKIINNNYELTRLLNIGNKYQREGEATLFELTAQNKAAEIMKQIDPVALMKVKTAKAELKEAFQKGIILGLANYPELVKKAIEGEALARNASNRTLKQKLILLAKLSDEDLSEAITAYIDARATGEMADIFNLVVGLLGKVQDVQPGLIGTVAAGLLSSVEADDLADFTGQVMAEILEAAVPVVAPIMPNIMNGLCDTMEAAMEEHPEEMPAALSRFVSIFTNGGEK